MKRLILMTVLLLLPAVYASAAPPREVLPQIQVGNLTVFDFQLIPNKGDFVLVDVRSEKARQQKSGYEAVGTVWLDPNSGEALKKFIQNTDRNKPILIYCA